MKLQYYFLSVILILSCSKNSEHEEQINESTSGYYLNFNVNEGPYSQNQDSFSVESIQDLDFDIVFVEAEYSKHTHLYSVYNYIPKDSIVIIGTIRFRKEGNSKFEKITYDLEFGLTEARKNLSKTGEKTYKYFDNSILYNQLKFKNFRNENLYKRNSKSIMLMTFPDTEELLFDSPQYSTVTSNGFYFPHENIEFSTIRYNERENTITLKGNFVVDIKMLSCGFFTTHAISDAEFQLIIN